MKQYDLIVIGGGPGGTEAAAIAAAKGLSVALVERDNLGGTCLNRGCIPTKCLCAAADEIVRLSRASEFGIGGEFKADYTIAHSRIDGVVGSLRDDLAAAMANVDVIFGEARIGEGRAVVAGAEFMKARHIVIATGSRPASLRVEGAELAVDSDAFLRCEQLPASLVIIGGGVIGLEFASVAAAYGCDVTVVEYCREVLPQFDPEIAKRLRSYLSRRGIRFILGAAVRRLAKVDGGVEVTYEAKGKEGSAVAETVLSAVGRVPVLPEGVADAGIELDERGFIRVDDRFATSAPGISAIGDVNGRCMLAHAASAQARVAMGLTEAIGVIPSVVFTVPECAAVGLCETSSEGLHAVKVPYSANSKALASGETDGFVKLVCDDRGIIVGCQAVGAHAADLVAEAAILIDGRVSASDFCHRAVCAHPGLSELLQTAASRF